VSSIQLKTEVPGPKSRAMLARRASAVPAGLGKATDVVVERAEGALVHDVDGNTFIDFVGGIGALAVGHCPPPVVEAMHRDVTRTVIAEFLYTFALCYVILNVATAKGTSGDGR